MISKSYKKTASSELEAVFYGSFKL